jgi:plastocyanin
MTASGYSPGEITVSPGSAIVWVNNSSAPHTVTADPQNVVPGGPDSSADFPSNVPPGSSWTWHVPQNAAPGTVWYYHCVLHGRSGDGKSIGTGMAGSITVK